MLIELSANENPYKHMEEKSQNLNRYMGYRDLEKLIKELALYTGCAENQIVVGPGTDHLIQKVLLNNTDKRLVILNPNFYRFTALAKSLKMKISRIQLKPPKFIVDWENLGIKNSIVVIDNPNNPTGKLMISRHELEKLLINNTVIIDEAGFEYSGETFADMVKDHKNLCITRTLDKAFGLAGLKVGYMIVGSAVYRNLDKSVDINRPAAELSIRAFKSKKYMLNTVEKTSKQKTILKKELEKLGFNVCESYANYLLVNTEVNDLALKLRHKEILIGDLSETWLRGYYRISIGNEKENSELIKELKVIMQGK